MEPSQPHCVPRTCERHSLEGGREQIGEAGTPNGVFSIGIVAVLLTWRPSPVKKSYVLSDS